MIQNIMELYTVFDKNMPERDWWPHENIWEIAVGAVLIQNTNWKNVEYSLSNIRDQVGFDPKSIMKVNEEELQELIRPSGFFKTKAKAIHQLLEWFARYDFDISQIDCFDVETVRKELLSIYGIGEETADVILVYVLHRTVFIPDRYSQRLFQYLGVEDASDYKKLKELVILPADFTNIQAQKFHGWIVDYGQKYLKNDEQWASGFLADFKLKYRSKESE